MLNKSEKTIVISDEYIYTPRIESAEQMAASPVFRHLSRCDEEPRIYLQADREWKVWQRAGQGV